MSRCFPFPPPGYEPKARTGIIDLLTKEKHSVKKHKKEKRDKEKREHKEKRDKDRSKDKRKEKDHKHKDRKKEKDRDKGRTSENIKAEGRAQSHNELHIKESWKKSDESKDSTFEEEVGKRTRDDWAENPTVVNLSNSIQRKIEGVGAASTSLEKERVAAIRMFSVQVASVQRRNDSSSRPIENVAISQRRTECISTATAMGKERNKMHGCVTSATALEKETSKLRERVAVGGGVTDKSRKNGISQSMESVSGLTIRKTEGSAAQRRKDSSIHGKNEVVGTPSLYSRIEGMDSVLTIEKERASGGEMLQVGQPVQKFIHKKVEGKRKTQGKQAEDRKGHKDSYDSVKKSKPKDEDRLTKEKKKEENIVENAEDIKHNKLINFGKKVQADALNSKLLAHKDNAVGIVCVEGTTKKRKYLDTYGYLQENDERPDKIPRITSSSQSLVNGRSFELHLTAPSNIPLKSGAISNLMPDRLLENNERKINGNAMSHPDSKYLSQIYTVPKMVELPEIDDRDWLFNCYDSLQKSEIDLKAEKNPQVFAEALRIESADVLALPYVVPF